MIDLAVFLLSIGGFSLLLVCTPARQQDWLGRKLGRTGCRAIRGSGLLLLALAYVGAASGLGFGYGAVAWLGWLTIAAALAVTAHTNRSRILLRRRR